jgi:hypothetical protein
MSDFMPGSPYFDETPKGILTWPKLLKIGLPIFGLLLIVSLHYDILIETMLAITAILTLLAITRK